MENDKEIIFAVIMGVAVFVILSLITAVLVIIQHNKVRKMQMKQQALQASFNQSLLQAQLEVQEQTFNHISREIHDNVGQLLSLAKVQINLIEQGETTDKTILAELKENIGSAMSDLRDIARSLSGDRLAGLGLTAAIQQEVERVNRGTGICISFIATGEERSLSSQKQLILFRVIQECLQNMIKHAEASIGTILLHFAEDRFQVTIQDNGNGFDTTTLQHSGAGLGLQNIFQRTKLIAGDAAIESKIGEGTRIKLIIPYE